MAVEMNENVCYNVPGTIMKGINKRNTEYENCNIKISSEQNSSSYLKSNQVTFNSSVTSMMKTCLAVTILIMLLLLVLSSAIVVLYLKVATLEALESTLSATQINKTLLNNLKRLQKDFREFVQQYNSSKEGIVNTTYYNVEQNLSFLEKIYGGITSLNYSVKTVANNLRNVLHPIVSYNQTCAEIAKSSNGYSSGDYILKLSTEAIRTVYCDMTSTLGGNTSGWMRIAKLDVDNCPKGFNKSIHISVNTCIRSESSAGCTEIRYSTHNVRYNNISGAVRAIAVNRLNGFRNVNLNSNYLDGVSVSSNNEHVWSFAAGCLCDEDTSSNNNNPNKPRFVGNDYICNGYRYLWRSQQCGSDSSWFFKMLPTTTADITVRVCRDQESNDEDIALTELELYIQ